MSWLAPINALGWARGNRVKVASAASVASATLVCSACTQNNEVRHVGSSPLGVLTEETHHQRDKGVRTIAPPARGRPIEVQRCSTEPSESEAL